MVQVTRILPRVLHLDFPDRVKMAKHLGRMQEYAENPRLARTVFSWSRLKNYAKPRTRKGYLKSALGYNIPSWAIRPFLDGAFDPLNPFEKAVLEEFRGEPGDFYVISTADRAAGKASKEALAHEVAHALWFTNHLYRAEVLVALGRFPHTQNVLSTLRGWGIYTEEVLLDEAHAYLGTDTVSEIQGRFHIKGPEVQEIHDTLAGILEKFWI